MRNKNELRLFKNNFEFRDYLLYLYKDYLIEKKKLQKRVWLLMYSIY